jgi:pseudaminic acid synthase
VLSEKTFIIAELSANHGHSFEVIKDSLDAIKEIGCNAVKIQTYTAESLTLDVDKEEFYANPEGPWAGTKLFSLYEKAAMPLEFQIKCFEYAKQIGLLCFSSPFAEKDVDFLEKLDNPIYKIASFEINHIPLIAYAASKGKPMIMSTGVASLEDIKLAIDTCHSVGNKDITLLHCTSQYPTPPEDANLNSMQTLANRFRVKVGLSDHTEGFLAPVIAKALGASVIEKHFILDKSIGGPDAHFSLDAQEFAAMVKAVRLTEQMLGDNAFSIEHKKSSRKYMRSIYASKNIAAGETYTEDNIKVVRPGGGLHPKYYKEILGRQASNKLECGEPLKSTSITRV